MSGSITDLSQRLHRDRSAVKRDIDELERIGLVEVEDMPFPGHGRQKRGSCCRRASIACDVIRNFSQLNPEGTLKETEV